MLNKEIVLGVIFCGSIALNVLILARYIFKVPFLHSFFQTKIIIPECSLEEADSIFTLNEFGTTLAAETHFVGRVNTPVSGAIKDSEGWVLSALAKKSKKIFEFGTCTGRTTYLLAKNGPQDAIVTTLTLSPSQKNHYIIEKNDEEKDIRHALGESKYNNFFYTGTPVEHKIQQIFLDSKKLNEAQYLDSYDLIFVDGSHAYSYVQSDSLKAIKMIKPGGIIFWHDYYYSKSAVPGVYQALNELSKTYPLRKISGTSFVIYRKPI